MKGKKHNRLKYEGIKKKKKTNLNSSKFKYDDTHFLKYQKKNFNTHFPIFLPNIIFGSSLTHFPSKYKHQINTTKNTTDLNIHNDYKHNSPFSQTFLN